ncbi:hypothetical protein EDD21DRAFT_403798 [Dissophora ornata]|nr:hypothetical protein EDD21DRAFT_403798 [Dissophora ornata]
MMYPNPLPTTLFHPAMLSAFTLAFLSALSLAQSPEPVHQMAYARAGPSFYVQGGLSTTNNQTTISSQLYALDLSTSWSADSPSWKALAGGIAFSLFYVVSSPDNQTIYTFMERNSVNSFAKYSIKLNTWQNTTAPLLGVILSSERPVADPSTGLVYIADMTGMDVYDTQTNNCKYTIATAFWTNHTATGDLPTPRADHCMATNEDGSTIVIFGGRLAASLANYSGALYVLDVASGVWKQGPPSTQRIYMSCFIVGDQFVVWGGYDGQNTVSVAPIIYNLTSMQWVTAYTTPSYYMKAASPSNPSAPAAKTTSSQAQTTPNSSNLGGIIGGIVGGLTAVALVASLFFYRKIEYNSLTQRKMVNEVERETHSDPLQGLQQNSQRDSKSHEQSSYYPNYTPQDIALKHEMYTSSLQGPHAPAADPTSQSTQERPINRRNPQEHNLVGRSPQETYAIRRGPQEISNYV